MADRDHFVEKAINTIRFLSADAVQKANSGHPGLPMGTATLAYTLWSRYLRFNPHNPFWVNRDRFILSGGHGSMLLYSLLFLTGYDLTKNDIENFRQWSSRTPGHPEYGLTPGVEATTGPLGQGFANGVGMAIAQAHLAATFNRPQHPIFDYFIYAIVTDGDLMEGVASEAASLAGHLQLGKLIYFYDDNRITIDGGTNLAFTEDRAARFSAYNWQVIRVEDGNDIDEIDLAIREAKSNPRPSLIICRTHIGYGLPTRQDTEKAHGEAPGAEELAEAKKRLNWPLEPSFLVPDDVREHFLLIGERGGRLEDEWLCLLDSYKKEYPESAAELSNRIAGVLPAEWDSELPIFPPDDKGLATRAASGKVLNVLSKKLPALVGGSADLTVSNQTWMSDYPSFQSQSPQGRNFHFGVREHSMGAILNGMALSRLLIPYGGTFLVFSDYLRPALRLSAMSHYPTIWIFTHDSIGLGEDGPTHQPVEHLAALRAIPNLVVIRPADANEVREAWKVAISRRNGPTALILSRQSTPTINREDYSPASGLANGAYVLADLGKDPIKLILMASGTEVNLIIKAGLDLASQGISVRLVSFPSWELFKTQDKAYQDEVMPPDVPARLAVEAGVRLGWERWIGQKGDMISIERFGASAPYQTIYREYGFTVEEIVRRAHSLMSIMSDGV